MSLFRINKVTVTLDVSDKHYGNGDARSVHLSAESPIGEGLEMEKIEVATGQLLDMFLEAFKGVHAARCVAGEIDYATLDKMVTRAETRTKKIKHAFLEEE
jgi:hypothetical protein